MTFFRKEFNLVSIIIIAKRRSGMTLEPEVNQLFAARFVKTSIRLNSLPHTLRMDNTRAVTRYLRSMEMRMKKKRKVTVEVGQVGQEQAKVAMGKEKLVVNKSLKWWIL